MAWLLDPLSRTLGLLLSGSLAVAVLTLALTRLRSTHLAALAGANLTILFLWFLALDRFGLPTWGLQVLFQRLMELPLVGGVAALCVVQARRLMPSEHRLRRALRAAPALLVCAWIVAFVGELAWPRPSLQPFMEIPVRNWALLTALCVPFQFYLWSLVYLFARSAGPRTPTLRLRTQNLFLAVAIGGYGLSSVNVLAGYAVLAFLDNPARTEVTMVQLGIEDRLFLLWAPALLVGLLLGAFPAIAQWRRVADAMALLPERERFEGLAWRLEETGALGRLTRPLYHLGSAARDLGLSESDAAKARQAVKLAAVMSSPKAPPALSRESASELLANLKCAGVHPPASWLSLVGGPHKATSPAHLPEILEAALHLSAPVAQPKPTGKPPWFELARAVCIDAGIGITSDPGGGRAVEAYREAANIPRGA